MPAWFREYIPEQVALALEHESAEETSYPGWRLAVLGEEVPAAMWALRVGAWWPLEKGGVEVRFGGDFSGVSLRLKETATGYDGQARTYQDVGEFSYTADARFDRVSCTHQPAVIDRRRRL